MLSRRQFLIRGVGALAGVMGGVGFYSWQIEPHWVEWVNLPLPLAHLPHDLVGKTVMQLSDLHIGTTVDSDYLIRALTQARALSPDFVLFTGDFISYQTVEHLDWVSEIMAFAPHGRLGTVAVLGNHDYGYNWAQMAVGEEIGQRLAELGISVLRNEAQSFSGLQLIGLDDYWGPYFDPWQILPVADFSQPTLVLCHNPDVADLASWRDFQGWIFSGHTHGGQVKPPFLPPPILPVQNKRYSAGIFPLSNQRTLYINRGLGYLRQIRFNVRPEITLFTLIQL